MPLRIVRPSSIDSPTNLSTPTTYRTRYWFPSQPVARFDVRLLQRSTAGMTKAENRAAARAWHRERQQALREQIRRAAVAADLAELDRLRRYLILEAKGGVSSERLIAAIDDHAELLTGDRTVLHGKAHSIG